MEFVCSLLAAVLALAARRMVSRTLKNRSSCVGIMPILTGGHAPHRCPCRVAGSWPPRPLPRKESFATTDVVFFGLVDTATVYGEYKVDVRRDRCGTHLQLYVPPGGPLVYSEGYNCQEWWEQDYAQREWYMGEFVRRGLAKVKEQSSKTSSVSDKDFGKRYPAILDHLATTVIDGKPCKSATLTLFVDQGTFKAALNSREGKASAFVSADTFTGLLDALEGQLQEDTVEWRPWGPQTQKGGKGR